MAEEFTAKFKVDISDLKKNISEATKAIKTANATFKAETAGMDKWSKDADGLGSKLKQLKTVLENQKSILSSYKSQLEAQQKAYEENGKRAEQLKSKLQELANQGIAKTDAKYKEYEASLRNVVKEQQNNEKAIDSLNIQILEQEAAVKTTEKQIGNYSDALTKLEEEQKKAAEEANRQKTAYENLEDTIEDQQKRLDALKDEYANVVLEQGKNSDSAKELAGEIDSLSAELADNKKALNDADEAADDLDHSLDELDPEEKAGEFTVLKGALANLVAEGIRMAVDAIKDFAKETIEVGKQFDKSMSNVAALSGATGEELQMLRDTAKEFGSSTQFSASEAADALGYMALAGWDANQSANALGGVLNLAASSGMDLAAASDMVTDYMSAFGMQADKSAYFADLLAYAQANANTTAQGLGEAFKNSAANMNASGQDIETTVSLLAMMANQGLKGSEAGTALTAVMRDMTKSMKDGAITIGETSVQVMDANGNYRDMTDILLDVEAATNGMGDAERATALQSAFTSDSIKGLNLILNAGVGEAAAFEQELRKSSGSAEEMANIMNNNLNGDLTALNSKLEGVQIALYEKFEPALRAGVDALSKMLDGLSWVIDNGGTIIGVLTGLATAIGTYAAITNAAAIKTGLLTAATKLATAAQAAFNFVMNMNPIALVISLIVGLVAAFVVLWNKSEAFREFWINLWEKVKEVTSAAWEAISGFFTGAWEGVKEAWGGVTDFFSGLWDGIKEIFSKIADWINTNVFQPIINFFEPVITFYREAWQIISELGKGCWEIIKRAWEIVSDWFKSKVIDPVKNYFTNMWNNIKDFASKTWEGIKNIWNVVSSWFDKTIITPVRNYFSNMWDNVKNAASKAWEGIKSVFKPVADWFEDKFKTAWTKVKNVFSTGGKIFDGIKEGITEAFKNVVNAIIRGINKVIAFPFNSINNVLDRIRSASILGISPFRNLGSISVPQIPELAQGGVLKRGQVGLLEGNGAEAVVPLDRNKAWIRAVANDLLNELTGKAGRSINNKNLTNNKELNFTQIINAPKQPSRIELYRQTRNLLAYANATGSV